MPVKAPSGFEEIPHTADWALRVWSPQFTGLLEYAARGMYSLMNVQYHEDAPVSRNLSIQGSDRETILVIFLEELLYIVEQENVGFTSFRFVDKVTLVEASLEGFRILSRTKEIKAVTYHYLKIVETPEGFATTIVFDV